MEREGRTPNSILLRPYQKRGHFSSRLLGVLVGVDAILTVGKKGMR